MCNKLFVWLFVCISSPALCQTGIVKLEEVQTLVSSRGATVTCRLINESAKSVVGYIVWGEYYDKRGKIVTSSATSTLIGFAGGSARPPIQPGETWNTTINIPVDSDKKPVSHKLSIDFVLYGDGTTWGPDVGRGGGRLLGLIQGVKAERNRLKAVLKRQGAQAVVDDLNKP